MKKKLVAAIACRNYSSRLYGKPVQNLCTQENYTVLDNIILGLKQTSAIDEIVLGIAEGKENEIFSNFAQTHHIQRVVGDETDVLMRLIACCEMASGTDIFRITSESPFPCLYLAEKAWEQHKKQEFEVTFLDDIIDGCGFEIISLEALKKSHLYGSTKHRSEFCSLFIRENAEEFRINKISPQKKLIRKDLRLTVDYPEDLIVCREIFNKFREEMPTPSIEKIVDFLDDHPHLKSLILPFTEEGYSTMYL